MFLCMSQLGIPSNSWPATEKWKTNSKESKLEINRKEYIQTLGIM